MIFWCPYYGKKEFCGMVQCFAEWHVAKTVEGWIETGFSSTGEGEYVIVCPD